MKVLVTGTRGFVGAAIERRLLAAGHTVVGAVRRRDLGAREVFLDLGEQAPIRGLPGDIEAVVHSAAMLATSRFSRETMVVNAGGTRRLLDWAGAAGVRHFVQISSIGAYGADCVGEDRREDTGLCWFPLMPAYLRSKAQAERHILAAGVPYTILRLPAVFGAGDTVVTPAIVPALLRAGVPRISGRDPRVSTLWVQNAAEAVAAVLARGPLRDAFNLTDGAARWSEFVGAFAAALGREVGWQKQGMHTLLTRSEDNENMYLVTTGHFGAHFPADKLLAALPALAFADWRDGVREAALAYRAAHGDEPVRAGLAGRQRRAGSV